MNIVNRLNRIKALQSQIDCRAEELKDLREKACSIHGCSYDQIRVRHAKNIHRIEDLVIQIDMLEGELAKEQYRLAKQKHDIMAVIYRLKNPLEVMILEKRYVSCKKWEDIAEEVHTSLRHCYRIHKDALKHLMEMYNQSCQLEGTFSVHKI